MSFRIVSRKKRLLVGGSAILVVVTLFVLGYLNSKPRNFGPKLISVDIYADSAREGLAFYEALGDTACVNIINEQVDKSSSSATSSVKAADAFLNAPLVRASAPTCKQPTPVPEQSAQLGKEGFVGLALNISSTGAIERGEVDKSSGFPELDALALKQVTETWQFKPCRKADKDVACRQTVKFRWKQ